ncbi:MAG: heavy-metal-associated domain-containing protein [Bacteroidia bacterium]|nr:heavy-metal-associated domain-containing protein [Bacteroidia bacterium]
MKQFISVLLLAFIFSSSHAQTKKTETVIIKTKIYCDHCLQCGSCGPNIKNAMLGLAGIIKVDINPKENTIAVTYKTKKTTPDKIRKAISETGFDADEMKASPVAYEKLDGCCKASN